MARVVNGRSNLYNAATRAKARKASLIDSTRMRQLLQQGPESIGVSIGELGYRTEMDIYATRMSGADAVEAALFHNLDNDTAEVMRFCQGHLKSLVGIYAERFDYEKAKTVLRAVNGGASDEFIASQILPSENPRNARWLDIVRNTETVAEAAAAMSGTSWGNEIALLDGEPSLEEMEDALDRRYYADALKAVKGRDGSPDLTRYIRTEIDYLNIVNQFRGIRQGLSSEKRTQLNIPGGKLGDTVLRQASQTESDEALLDALRRSNAFDDSGFEEAIQESANSGSLDAIVSILTHKKSALLSRFAYLNPVSPFPVIYYIERKLLEVRNLRLLVRGKAIGLSNEALEAHMDF